MDPITQRITAVGVITIILSSIACLGWIAVAHDGTIVPEVVQTLQNLIGQAILVTGPIIALVFHIRSNGTTPPTTPTSTP